MRNIILTVLLLVLAGEIGTLTFMHRKPEEKVLAEAVAPTPTDTPSPSPTPSPEPTLRPTPSPTKTPAPQPQFTSQEINGFIDRFAGQYGVDPNVLRRIAICESGFNPLAFNTGYAGLYQFGPITWKNIRVQISEDPALDLRYNAEEAVQTAAYAISQGKIGIWPNCQP